MRVQRSLLEGSVEEFRGVPTMRLVIVLGQYYIILLAMSY